MVDVKESIDLGAAMRGQLEVCIDSLESASNAIKGGAHELEVCSSLVEGGLTPSPGLVAEIIKNMKLKKSEQNITASSCSTEYVPKINIMIRCRGGSDFCYTEHEIKTMVADIHFYKQMGVDRFVFGALTEDQEIDIESCSKIIEEAKPIPVTFHRAFDLSSDPINSMEQIISLGFNRVLTSGQKQSAADLDAVKLIKELADQYGNRIEIMPGSGVNLNNVTAFLDMGFKIVHSSCKIVRNTVKVKNDLAMGNSDVFVTDESNVRSMVAIINGRT